MFNTLLAISLIWNLVLTVGFFYLFIMNHIQQEINESVEECLGEINADYDRAA